jgi:hypothetical protein
MTEVSDFSQKMGGAGPAGLPEMQATAAWQAAWGVTDFTLYYSLADRSAETFRAYCDYVGRINSVLQEARPTPEVLLYYPIYDLWAEYLPVAEPLRLDAQSARARQIVSSFMQLGRALQRSQIPFTLIDHEHLAAAAAKPKAALAIQDRSYKSLILPEAVELPPEAQATVDAFRRCGGQVVLDGPEAEKHLVAKLNPSFRLSPASERIALGQFQRDDRQILLLANVARLTYSGHLVAKTSGTWWAVDPGSGAIRPCKTDDAGRIALELPALQATLLVQASPVEARNDQ